MEPPVDLEQKKILSSRRSVFILNGTVIVAYNTDQPYPPQISPNPESPNFRRLHLPSYESNNVPYLCAALASPDYTGVLLGPLRQTDTQFPIIESGGKYRLDPIIADSWLSLEKALESIGLHLILSVDPFVSLDYKFPPTPSLFGFTRTFDNMHSALNAIGKSRDAFQILFAHIAWGAILHRARAMYKTINLGTYEDGDIIVQPKRNFDLSPEELVACDSGWKSVLQRTRNKVHPALVHALVQSSVCDFSAKRAGVVIRKPQDWLYSNLIPYLVLSNVPVWMVWGEPKAQTSSIKWKWSMKGLYGPNLYEKTYAHTWTACMESGNQHVLPSPPTFPLACAVTQSSTSASLDKKTEHRTVTFEDQLEFTVWLRRRKEEIEAAKLRATPEQLHRYNQRQVEAQKFECPGKRGAIVYEWDTNERNTLTRLLVNRAQVPQVWSMYGNKQRWFNCVRNEWDLCHELDPDDTPCDTDSDIEYMWATDNDIVDLGVNDSEYISSSSYWKEKPIHLDSLDVNACLTNAQITASSNDLSNDLSHTPDIALTTSMESGALKLLSSRFGFAFSRGSVYTTASKRQWSLSKAMGVIGDSKGRQTFTVPDGLESSIIHFIMHLATIGHPDATLSDVPSSLCDLYPENSCYIAQVPSFVRIQTVDAGGIPLYLLHHSQDKDREWTLAVTDPCTALMAIRSDPPTITEFAMGLIHSRTPFLTLKKADSGNVLGTSRRPPKHKRRRFGLGERPPGHKLDKTDYIVYEAERVRLLDNQRIARAAVKRGGILSRLVADLVDDSEILAGPSCSALEHPFKVTVNMAGEQVSFFDDDLSDEEISLLVGLYSIRADTKATPAESSWWPTAGKFEDSGLNIGVWTPKCEEWFLKRRSCILEQTHGASTASNWRNHLRFDMDTKRVYKGAKILAAHYISKHFSN